MNHRLQRTNRPKQARLARSVFCSGIAAVVLMTGLATPAFAQQPGIESKIDALLEAADRMRTQASVQTPSVTPTPAAQPPMIQQAPATTETDTSKKAKEIRERLNLLRRLRRSNAASNKTNPSPATVDPTPALPPTLKPVPATTPAPPPPSSLPDIEASIDAQKAEQATPQALTSMAAKTVLPGAIDHLQLGETLFQTKNYAAAIKALKAVDTSALSADDKRWIQLLISLCNRRLGDQTESDRMFREMVNESGGRPSRVTPLAKWWLKQNATIMNAKETVKSLDEQYDALVNRTKSYEDQQ